MFRIEVGCEDATQLINVEKWMDSAVTNETQYSSLLSRKATLSQHIASQSFVTESGHVGSSEQFSDSEQVIKTSCFSY